MVDVNLHIKVAVPLYFDLVSSITLFSDFISASLLTHTFRSFKFIMSFHYSAEDIRVDDGHILRARLQRADGEWNDAEIDLDNFIGNDNGELSGSIAVKDPTDIPQATSTGMARASPVLLKTSTSLSKATAPFLSSVPLSSTRRATHRSVTSISPSASPTTTATLTTVNHAVDL